MSTKRYDSLPKWAQDVVDRVFPDSRNESLAVDRLSTAQAVEILESGAEIYHPMDAEYNLWAAAAPKSWAKVKGRYHPETIIRILEEQGLTDFMGLLKKSSNLYSPDPNRPVGSEWNRRVFLLCLGIRDR
jgi:hypothetical protein